MRNIVATMLAASVFSLVAAHPTYALPAVSPGGGAQVDARSDVQESRVYCYNRYSGNFLHWGACGVRYHPRVYCRNTYTGQFLHWGACW